MSQSSGAELGCRFEVELITRVEWFEELKCISNFLIIASSTN